MMRMIGKREKKLRVRRRGKFDRGRGRFDRYLMLSAQPKTLVIWSRSDKLLHTLRLLTKHMF